MKARITEAIGQLRSGDKHQPSADNGSTAAAIGVTSSAPQFAVRSRHAVSSDSRHLGPSAGHFRRACSGLCAVRYKAGQSARLGSSQVHLPRSRRQTDPDSVSYQAAPVVSTLVDARRDPRVIVYKGAWTVGVSAGPRNRSWQTAGRRTRPTVAP